MTYGVIYNPNDKTATGASSNVLVIFQLFSRDLEAVPTGAGIMKDPLLVIPSHVLNLYLVVVHSHGADCCQKNKEEHWQMFVARKMVFGGKLAKFLTVNSES